MKTLLSILALAVLCGCEAAQPSQTPSYTNGVAFTNLSWYRAHDWGSNFLTISNRVWVKMDGTAIVRVADDEWKMITNQYRHNLTTNHLIFYGTNHVGNP